jgi:hypothetical protein
VIQKPFGAGPYSILVFADFRPFSGQTWPQDPFRRVRLETRCRTHLKSAQETKSNASSSHFLKFEGADTETLEVGAGCLSFCGFSTCLVVFCRFPAGFLVLPAPFEGLRFCGGVSVDRNLLGRALLLGRFSVECVSSSSPLGGPTSPQAVLSARLGPETMSRRRSHKLSVRSTA